MGTRFSRRARRQIAPTEQTRAATTEAWPTPASVTEANVTGTAVVGHQIPALEQTLVASIRKTCPTPANGTRTETDTAGTGQGSSHPGDGLTLVKLKMIKYADGKPLRMIQKIAAGDYMTFGMLLLQDDNGEEVTVIKRDHIHDGAESVTQAILIKWLTSGAAPTRTYQHLIACLRQSELGALADNIADTVAGEDPTAEGLAKEMTIKKQKLIHSEATQDADLLVSYASYLKGLFMSMSHQQLSQHWTYLTLCEFIQLALITDETVRRSGPTEEFVQLAQVGRIEKIMSQSQQVYLVDLLSLPSVSPPNPPNPPPPSPSTLSPTSHQMDQQSNLNVLMMLPPLKHRILLIEGPPGGGKSTLALHICHKWALGASFMARFNLVVLAYLRDRAVQNATTLADILPADITRGAMCTSDIATQIMAFNGLRVLFIFDGWDEFPSHLQNESLVSTIIQKPHELCVQQSTVIITSRPVASGNLLHIADQRVEILGFTSHQIHEYIEKSLNGNSTHIQKLVQHLEDHPVIQGYCYVPLHAAILVHVFLTMKGVLPTTLHGLFCKFVLCCIVRELETHESRQILSNLSSLDNLPGDVKSQLSYLCVLAYEGVLQDKVVFYQTDLEALHIPENLPSLGLLQAIEGLTLYSKSLSYNFLHLSVQELLAAYHISQMDPIKQVEIFKSLLESPRFHSVMRYYGGFTKLANPAIRDFISKYVTQQSSFDNILPFLHCFFEAHERSLCLLVDGKFRSINLEIAMNPVVFSSVGYFITSVLIMSTFDAPNELYLGIKSANDHQMKLLLTELSKCPVVKLSTTGTLPCRLAIDLHYSNITRNGVMLIISFIKQSSPLVTELMLHDGDIQGDEDVLVHMARALVTNSYFTKLQLKKMSIHTVHVQSYDALMEILLKNRSLIHLSLSSNKSFFSGTGAQGFFKVLQCNTTLVHLDLYRTGVTDTEAVYIAQFLITNHSIQTLDISGNHIGEHGFACIAKSLKSNLNIRRLYITCAGNIDKHVKAVYQARRDKKLNPLKVFNDYSKEVELSAAVLRQVRNTDDKFKIKFHNTDDESKSVHFTTQASLLSQNSDSFLFSPDSSGNSDDYMFIYDFVCL